ncbi:LppP/LprE family lipoprotein [Actinomyces radicidentis]|uniref:LppP/LprE family lipoprotein n=1 Tax=Actinomyces radicidentis TaxID=111015 RepID=UPI0026E05847|nr:LppP/LprE family lipoprotein [Actinomyces radicidentis]
MMTTPTAPPTRSPHTRTRRPRAGAAALLVAPALALAGCGGQAEDAASQAPSAGSAQSAATSATSPTTDATRQTEQTEQSDQSQQTALAVAPSDTAAATTAAAEPTCATTSGSEALEQNLSQVPADSRGFPWTADYAETDGYDPCAALSWITVSIEGGTASSPYQIMLFHHGRYIGTTASDGIGFHPDVVRLSDSEIQVTYMYTLEGKANAEASGRSVSTFTWDEATGSIVHGGEWPPEVQD